ncbi:hypothetical protein OIDMADRAFT_53154 [Oidiodendron maius Zn]|uniref:Uncharacterized protein n=1 Tax=Oidiodendron maius (strain Zn) TaxID=913774 RepID=A0A0C3CRK9_OIDMZ|nr:hypothetical protein OIDMADRAFT_53154 [Oidiodendron maius Zn]
MSGHYSDQQSHNTPTQASVGRSHAAPALVATAQQKPSADPANIADRMIIFLCSFWAGKEPNCDVDSSASKSLIAANFSSVIRVSEPTATGTGTGYSTNSR